MIDAVICSATSSLLLTHDLQATALTNVDDTALHELDAVSEASDDVSTTERLRDVMQRLQLERSQVALGEVLMEGGRADYVPNSTTSGFISKGQSCMLL